MLKRIAEYIKILSLYRKVKNPYNRYHAAEFLRVSAQMDTGVPEHLPKTLEACDTHYKAFCIASEDIRSVFSEDEQEEHIKELSELMMRDMWIDYYG